MSGTAENIGMMNYKIGSQAEDIAYRSTELHYKLLDHYTIQLFNWVAYKPNMLNEFKEYLKRVYSKNLAQIASLVDGGTFEGNSIESEKDSDVIRFPKLRFIMDLGGLSQRKIECEARIRINTCNKLPLVTFDLNDDFLREMSLEDRVKGLLKKSDFNEITLKKECETSEGEKTVIWSFFDSGFDFLLILDGKKLALFNKAIAPYSSKIIIIIAPLNQRRNFLSGIDYSEFEKTRFFNNSEQITEKILELVSKIYLNERFDFSKSPRIIIKSAATNDSRMVFLLEDILDENDQISLSKKVVDDNYRQIVINGLLTSIQQKEARGLISKIIPLDIYRHNLYQHIHKRMKIIESEYAKGLYCCTQTDQATTTSAIFYFEGQKSSSVYEIINGWVLEIIKNL